MTNQATTRSTAIASAPTDEQGPDERPLGRLDAHQRRCDGEDHVRLAPRSVRTRYCIEPSTDGRCWMRPVGVRRDPGRVGGECRAGDRGRSAKPDGNARVTLPRRSRRITAMRRPASVSELVRSASRWIRSSLSVMDSSSRSTRSTRLARVRHHEDARHDERDREHRRQRDEQSGAQAHGRLSRPRRPAPVGAQHVAEAAHRPQQRGSASSSLRRR